MKVSRKFTVASLIATLPAALASANGVVDLDLGTLGEGTTNLTGTTIGGNSNIDLYSPLSDVTGANIWDQEFIYQFTTTEPYLIDFTSDDPDGVPDFNTDNDFFLLNSLSTTTNEGGFDVATNINAGLANVSGSFGIVDPGTYFFVVDAFVGDVSEDPTLFAVPGPFNVDLNLTEVPPAGSFNPVASYYFNNSLAANEPAAPELQALNPLGNNAFTPTTTVPVNLTAGETADRTVYTFDGDPGSAGDGSPNAGLILTAADNLLTDTDTYSVEMLFELDSTDGFVKLLDLDSRQTDTGIYNNGGGTYTYSEAGGDPSNVQGGSLTADEYVHVLLVVEDGTYNVFVDGASVGDPNGLSIDPTYTGFDLGDTTGDLTFFADDAVFDFAEVSDGSVAKIALYDQALNITEISLLIAELFPEVSVIGGLAADFNGNGAVEQGDLDLVLTNWGTARTFEDDVTTFSTSIVDQEELDAVLTQWGSSTAPSFGSSPIPEPASLTLLGGLALAGLRRRSA